MTSWFEDTCTWPEVTRYEYTQWALGNVNTETGKQGDTELFFAYLDAVFAAGATQ